MGRSHDLATGVSYQDQTESDTRYVNTTGDTMTGNLAINNASGSQVTLHRSDTTIANDDLVGQIIMSGDDADTNASGTRGFIRGKSQGTGGGLKMEFGTAGGGVVIGDPRMTINADGYVTKPYQPAFFARHTTAAAYSSAYVTNWSTVTYNVGNHFAGSTGIFTAPVAGVYQLNAMIGNNYAQGAGNYNVKVNDVNVSGLIFDPYAGQNTWASSILVGQVKISANDTVKIYCSGAGYPDNSSWTSWSMYLLG